MKLESHEFNVMDVVTISTDDIMLQMMALQGVNDIQTSEYICIQLVPGINKIVCLLLVLSIGIIYMIKCQNFINFLIRVHSTRVLTKPPKIDEILVN